VSEKLDREYIGRLAEEIKVLKEALVEIQKSNRMNNDLDAYLFDLADWALGKENKKPNPVDYGI